MWEMMYVEEDLNFLDCDGFQCFEGSYCLYLEGHSIQEEYPFE